MPFIEDDTADLSGVLAFQGLPEAPAAGSPRFFTETIPAAFRQENVIGAALVNHRAPTMERTASGAWQYRFEEGFDPLDADYLAGYEEHADRFAFALTRDQGEAIRANIDRERVDRDTLARSGLPGMAAMLAAGVLDPTILIPVGGQITKGASLLRGAARTAAAAAGGAAIQEFGLASQQETRTGEEMAWGIGGAALLGGVLGGAAQAFMKTDIGRAAAARVEDDMRMPAEAEPDWNDPLQAIPAEDPRPAGTYRRAGSVGAAAADDVTLDEQAIEGVLARAVGEAVRQQDPVLRGITSQSLRHRQVIEQLADIPAGLVKNKARWAVRTLEDGREQRYLVWGRRTEQSVESHIKRREADLGRALRSADDFYIRHLRGRERRMGDILGSGIQSLAGRTPAGKLTRPDFHTEVVRALRRGDQHDIPEVAEAARSIREQYLDPLKDEAVELGLFGYEMRLSDDPDAPPQLVPRQPSVGDTADSWIARVYNREMIAAQRPEFTRIIHRHFMRRRDEAAQRAEQLAAQVTALKEQAASFRGFARSILTRRDRSLREARDAVRRAEAADRAARAVKREATTQSNEAGRRSEKTHIVELSPLDRSYYRGYLRDAQRGHGAERPVTLSQFIRSQGGLTDEAGELAAMGAGRGLVNNKSGRSLDDMAMAASEEGYIGQRLADGDIERGDINELLDALREELSGSPRYSDQDLELVQYEDMLAALGEAADEQGLSLGSMSVDEFASWMEGKRYRTASSFQKGRHQEALLRERAAGKRQRAAADRAEFAEIDLYEAQVMARTVRETAPELTEQANALRREFKRARAEARRQAREQGRQAARADKSDADLLEDAERTVDHIMGGPAGRLSFDGPGSVTPGPVRNDSAAWLSGRFKARVLDIPDREIEAFLENDLEHILRLVHRSMVPDIALTRRFGSVDMEVQRKEISEEYNALIQRAPNERARQALERKKKNALSDIEGVRDRLRGAYGLPADANGVGHRLARGAVSLNYLRLMGGVTLSSIPDAARAVMTHGVTAALGAPLRALTGDLTALRQLSAEVEDAGPGFEMVMNTRARAMADIMDDYGRHSRLERAISGAQAHFGYASLIAPWNHAMKMISGYAVQNRILRLAERAASGRIGERDATWLAGLGFGGDDVRRLGEMFAKHGETEGGQRLANSRAWEDAALRERWLNALRQEVDRLIVTPGMDKPLLASTDLGRVILQFRSYNFAATQRVLLAYMQGLSARDAHAAMALFTQIGLGMMVAKLKAGQYGLDTSDWQTERWLVEGIDRSGVMGVFTDLNMMLEHTTRGELGLSALAGEGRLTRYQTRNALGAYLGPTFGAVQDTLTASSGAVSAVIPGEDDEAIRRSDVTAARRLMPYQNLFWARGLFDAVEAGAADAVGAEE